jgi:calcium/calmodulin-dependent protein kinase I
LLPEIRAYLAKARLRRGIEIVKLANRIEALKMQEDEADVVPGESDVPADAEASAVGALSGDHVESSGGKKGLGHIPKGAIFREVVLAKVREAKEQEEAAQVEKHAHDIAAQRSSD